MKLQFYDLKMWCFTYWLLAINILGQQQVQEYIPLPVDGEKGPMGIHKRTDEATVKLYMEFIFHAISLPHWLANAKPMAWPYYSSIALV